ncbi:glycoside hydrolase family 68 protein [Streptococcus dentapri]|uniref:Glycoside hydrolase family 68 protein n=1 Tax=Streptococcus dentapri TaxID=573564 RepID=A0ABV8D0W7_9STRE
MVVRKKMRKSKKQWVIVSVATATLAIGIQGGRVAAETLESKAGETNTSLQETGTSQSSTTDTSSDQTTENIQSFPSSEAVSSETVTASSDNQTAASEPAAEQANVEEQSEDSDKADLSVAGESSTKANAKAALDQNSDGDVPTLEHTDTTPYNPKSGLTEESYRTAQAAGLDIANLTTDQKNALNRLQMTSDAETGTQMTYKQFQEIADVLVAQDPRYAIPYFKAEAVKNMPAATTRDAQTGQVTDLDVWDSWPVQDAKTGQVINWNGYQLVIAMMGEPNHNDNHIYLLYNKYGDNDLSHWKNAGSIFGYGQDAITQQWSGSASVNSDGSIQLYYTKVDTSDNNSNNQKLASATLNLSFDDENVYLDSVENDQVLTPNGGDGYYYQSYAQWRSTYTGADNIAMRDPHIVEDDNGERYLIFEASTGTQNYQGEDQIYNWSNYGGDAAYNVKSLFRILSNSDMHERASISNAAIGILKLTGDEKTPQVAQYYTPLVSSPMVSDEIERPGLVKLGDKYYLFAATRLNHGSNNDAWNKANDVVGDNVVMLGYVSDSLTGGYKPLNGHGAVLTASVPSDWRTATYSYYAVPIEGSDDTVLITAYMTNRNEVAGKGNNSTWAPSFLMKIMPDNTTRVLAKMTQQGDWIWDEGSESQDMVGTLETAHLPGEDDGYIDWNVIGGYGLKPHDPAPDSNKNDSQNPDKDKDDTKGTPESNITINYNINISGSVNLSGQGLKDIIAQLLSYTAKVSQSNNISVHDNTVNITVNYKTDDKTKEKTALAVDKEVKSQPKKDQPKTSANTGFLAAGLSLASIMFGYLKLKRD